MVANQRLAVANTCSLHSFYHGLERRSPLRVPSPVFSGSGDIVDVFVGVCNGVLRINLELLSVLGVLQLEFLLARLTWPCLFRPDRMSILIGG